MPRQETKHSTLRETLKRLTVILKIMKVRPQFFIIQIVGSLLVAFFEGLSFALLIPLAKGVIERDFSFLKEIHVFNFLLAQSPSLLREKYNTSLFLLLTFAIFSAAVIKNMLHYLYRVYISRKKQGYLFTLKKAVFYRALTFGKLYFDRSSQGYFNQLMAFLSSVAGAIDTLSDFSIHVSTLAAYLIIMFSISWELTAAILIVFPLLTLAVRWIVHKIRQTAKIHTEVTMQLGREVFNILSCIALVKAYNREEQAKERFGKLNEKLRDLQFSLEKKWKLVAPLQEIISLAAVLLLISLVAFRFVKSGAGQVPGYVLFFVLARRCVPLVGAFDRFRAQFAHIEAPIDKVLEIMSDEDKFFISSGSREFGGLQKSIELRRLDFSYSPGTLALRELSFTIDKGKITAIVGPTGSGKSTIVSLIMRFYECPPGTIFVDGYDIGEYDLESLKHHIAFVSQEALIFNDTLRRNITYGGQGKSSNQKIMNVVEKARLETFVSRLPDGLDTEVGDMGVMLSGGEKQRVAIARALYKESEILILDEATSALDTHTERLIQEAIEEAVRGRTAIVIAHRLSTIRNADKVIVIEEGRLIEQGGLEGLLEKKGKFYQYWQEQKFF
jgi:subfamily B ATP-binding cassette protein MsbA